MASVTSNQVITRGDTATLLVTVSNLPAGGLATFPDVRFTAKRDVSDADGAAIISKNLSSGIIVTTNGGTNVNGVLSISIAPADTQALPAGYVSALQYDVRIYDNLGDAWTVAQGMLTVTPTATQATT